MTLVDDLVDINSHAKIISKFFYKKLIDRCKASSIQSRDVREIFTKLNLMILRL